jgi:beta-lactam-binding protein with PASTA domain
VPRLRGRTLAAARRALRAAGCRAGRVRGAKGKATKARVARQSVRAGRTVAAGTRVALVLRVRKRT